MHSGMTTIRAWGYGRKFTDMVRMRADDYTRPYYLISAANRWLSFRVEFYASVVALFAGLFIIWNIDSIDAGLAGFAMTYALTLTLIILVCILLGGCDVIVWDWVDNLSCVHADGDSTLQRDGDGNEQRGASQGVLGGGAGSTRCCGRKAATRSCKRASCAVWSVLSSEMVCCSGPPTEQSRFAISWWATHPTCLQCSTT